MLSISAPNLEAARSVFTFATLIDKINFLPWSGFVALTPHHEQSNVSTHVGVGCPCQRYDETLLVQDNTQKPICNDLLLSLKKVLFTLKKNSYGTGLKRKTFSAERGKLE